MFEDCAVEKKEVGDLDSFSYFVSLLVLCLLLIEDGRGLGQLANYQKVSKSRNTNVFF